MEILILIPLGLLALLFYAVWAVTRLRGRVRQLEWTLDRFRVDLDALRVGEPEQPRPAPVISAPVTEALRVRREVREAQAVASTPPVSVGEWPPAGLSPAAASAAVPPPLPVQPAVALPGFATPGAVLSPAIATATAVPELAPAAPAKAALWAGLDLEQFMGVKLFAWIGGLVLFLAAAFFLKHSFEQGWVSPELRVTIGFLTGLGLLVGGVRLKRPAYRVMAHTLCGAGVVILYAASFAAHAYYQLLGNATSFALMSLVTVVAFLLAARLPAMVVAVLGLLGGFLTPPLLSTGVDRPGALFGYIALLDGALVAVALKRRWPILVALAALGTVLMQVGWVAKFFEVGKVSTAWVIFTAFGALFLAAYVFERRRGEPTWWVRGSALGLPLVTFLFTAWLLTFNELGQRPGVVFLFLVVADAGWLVLAALDGRLRLLHTAAGGFSFLLLAGWTTAHLGTELLPWALGGYLGFAVVHTLFPLLLERHRPGAAPLAYGHVFPLLALVLVIGPLLREVSVPWAVWPVVLLVDALAIGLALLTGSVLGVLGVVGLTVVVTAVWLLNGPAELTVLPELLVVTGLFAVFFFGAGLLLGRRFVTESGGLTRVGAGAAKELAWAGLELPPAGLRELIPASAAILPFLLLILAVGRLPLVSPTPIFGLALVLVGLMLTTARLFRTALLVPMGLACVLALEVTWHGARFGVEAAGVTLAWYLLFAVVFAAYPFGCRSVWSERMLPWATAALSGPLHFFLVYRVVKLAWPNEVMGLLPAAFAVPMLGALAYVRKGMPVVGEERTRLLAWFGGSALFFITLIFPIQFDREWLTLGWALEGVALLWLFRRVPHPGLRGVGLALLGLAFVRLALNPAVFEYHPRSATRILNWFLYSYGVVTVCLLAGARLLAPPRHRVGGVEAPPWLYTLAGVLAFLLLNIEIADWFSTGATLTFNFSASLGQDMTYSIAWGAYAFLLLVLGFRFESAWARYGGLGLLVVTLLKLFLNDLFRLGGLYRVGSLIGLAVVLMLVSFAYQRFFAGSGRRSMEIGAPASGPPT
jgi:uncharacterized membrane protein